MTTELVRQDAYGRATLDEKYRYVKAIANAGDLLPRALMGKPRPNPNGGIFPAEIEVGKILLLAETGSELGIGPMAALQSIYIVDGKPSLSSSLLSALVRKAGHKLRVSTSGSASDGTLKARAELTRSDDPDFTFVTEWTLERAQRAGLANKDNWKKYPEAMLKSRVMTEVIREGASDVTIFPAYAPEELGARVDESGAPTEDIELVETSHRETVAPEPREQTPVVEPQPEEVPLLSDTKWGPLIAGAETARDMGAVYQEARKAGALSTLVTLDGGEVSEIGQIIITRGNELRVAEEVEVQAEIVDEDDDAPMALGVDTE